MVGAGTHKMLHPSWVSISAYVSEYWSVIIATVVFAFVGVVTIYYTVHQLNKNISLSLIKAIKARAKRYKKWKDKVPAASHKRVLEVCFPSQYSGGTIHQCDMCGATVHPSCLGNAHKDYKCVSMAGLDHVLHQWAVQWINSADHSEEDLLLL
jgi:diacylglycerol kinase (ATP)